MNSLWTHYGLIMDSLWNTPELIMDSLWNYTELIMDSLWTHYGTSQTFNCNTLLQMLHVKD